MQHPCPFLLCLYPRMYSAYVLHTNLTTVRIYQVQGCNRRWAIKRPESTSLFARLSESKGGNKHTHTLLLQSMYYVSCMKQLSAKLYSHKLNSFLTKMMLMCFANKMPIVEIMKEKLTQIGHMLHDKHLVLYRCLPLKIHLDFHLQPDHTFS